MLDPVRDGAGHSCSQEPVTLRRAAEAHIFQADWEKAWITVWSCRVLQEPHRNVGVDSLGILWLRTLTQYLQRALRILSGIQVTLHFFFWGSWPDYTPISSLRTGVKIPKEEYTSVNIEYRLSIWERGWDPWWMSFESRNQHTEWRACLHTLAHSCIQGPHNSLWYLFIFGKCDKLAHGEWGQYWTHMLWEDGIWKAPISLTINLQISEGGGSLNRAIFSNANKTF